MNAGLRIGERLVGEGHPCLVIAEAGVNHNGDIGRAHDLVDLAADCGADAVKFQTFDPAALVSAAADAAPYQRERGGDSQRAMLDALVLPERAWRELADHAVERELVFTSTAFDSASLDLLLEIGVQMLKVPSGELDNLAYVEEVASKGLPLILSTGLGTMNEVAAAYEAASAAPGVAILHCVTAYPAPVESSNLRAITTMAERFGVPVGWSDHTQGYVTAVAAVALGASILEKHVTTDHALPGPDHVASSDPDEFAAYVDAVRAVEAGLGDGVKRPAKAEEENRVHARRSFHAVRALQPGETVAEVDVQLMRPAIGLPPSAEVVGRVVRRTIEAGQPLTDEDLA
jgi:N-acetylneuraminate synthase/N,N'-diacetyllegionaminate synthase